MIEDAYPKSCKNCRHYCPVSYGLELDDDSDQLEADYGECRRFPPKVSAPEESGFPIVEEFCWCGEFDF